MAGQLERTNKRILISRRFRAPVQRFTAAHELGHWVLHPGELMHRDRPVGGELIRGSRSNVERQADYFAASFLIPEKLVMRAFERRFGKPPLYVDDDIAYHLGGGDPESVFSATNSQLAGMFASFKNPRLMPVSLAEEFMVSVGAMAVRLEELRAFA